LEKYSVGSHEVVVLECRYETAIWSIMMWVLNLFGWILIVSGIAGYVFEALFDNQYQSVNIDNQFEYIIAGVVVLAIDKIMDKLDAIKELLEKQSGKD
jgi:hypothetical protein